jgi:hypothetical protein
VFVPVDGVSPGFSELLGEPVQPLSTGGGSWAVQPGAQVTLMQGVRFGLTCTCRYHLDMLVEGLAGMGNQTLVTEQFTSVATCKARMYPLWGTWMFLDALP